MGFIQKGSLKIRIPDQRHFPVPESEVVSETNSCYTSLEFLFLQLTVIVSLKLCTLNQVRDFFKL